MRLRTAGSATPEWVSRGQRRKWLTTSSTIKTKMPPGETNLNRWVDRPVRARPLPVDYMRTCLSNKSHIWVLVKFASDLSRDREGAGFSLENRGHRLLARDSVRNRPVPTFEASRRLVSIRES